MRRDISTLTTGQVKDILAVAPRTVAQLVDDGKLKGGRLPGSKDRRVYLTDLLKFMNTYNFPRTRLLRFLEDHGATKAELGEWGIDSITEPIGTGDIRFYPEIPPYSEPENTPDILTSGKLAKLFNCAPRTASKMIDNSILNGYRIPPIRPSKGDRRPSKGDRRVTVDDLVRFYAKQEPPIPINPELKNRTPLLIGYPGGWEESQKTADNQNYKESVWYRQNEQVQEVSVRCEKNGLYVKLEDAIYNLILLGMTEREEFGKVAHPNHAQEILFYIERGIELLEEVEKSISTNKVKEILKKLENQFKIYFPNI